MDEPHHDAAGDGVVHVATPTLLLSAFPLLCIAFIANKFELGLENTLIVGIARSFIQLSILGLILHPIFLLGMDMPWIVGLYVLFMILIATVSRASFLLMFLAHLDDINLHSYFPYTEGIHVETKIYISISSFDDFLGTPFVDNCRGYLCIHVYNPTESNLESVLCNPNLWNAYGELYQWGVTDCQ